jgi:hypothetical protein
MLADLWRTGWYEEHLERTELDWLVRDRSYMGHNEFQNNAAIVSPVSGLSRPTDVV